MVGVEKIIFIKKQNIMEEYTFLINRSVEKKQNCILKNSSIKHARIILQAIFKNAEKDVYIFAGNLGDLVPPRTEYLYSMKRFLEDTPKKKFGKPLVRFSVILADFPDKNSSAIKIIKEYREKFPEQIKLTILDPSGLPKVLEAFGGKVHYFTVADDHMFREETEIDRCYAIVNFNDIKKSKILKELFLSLPTTDYEPPISRDIKKQIPFFEKLKRIIFWWKTFRYA